MAHSHAAPAPVALPGVSKIVAIGSGKGGVGKTTVAVNLAVALSRLGQRVGLIDADIYGPNVPLMMGSTQQPRVSAENQIQPNDTHGIKTISIGYISPGDKPLVMRGPMLHQIIRQFLQQVDWGELDYLIVDLPPGQATSSFRWCRPCRSPALSLSPRPAMSAFKTHARLSKCLPRSTSKCSASSKT